MNDQFRETHPDLDPSLTLSKIRKVKDLLVEVASKPDIDLEASTVAISFVFFEKLVMNHFVTKANRKLVAAACLMLAAKSNDPKFVVGQNFYSPLYEVTIFAPLSLKEHTFTFFFLAGNGESALRVKKGGDGYRVRNIFAARFQPPCALRAHYPPCYEDH